MPELVTYYPAPVEVTPSDVGPLTAYPIVVPEASVVAWHWRVKSWTFAYNLNFRIESEAYDFNLTDSVVFENVAESESDLPCDSNINSNNLFEGVDIGGGFTATGGIGMFLFAAYPQIVSVGSDLYPYLQIFLSITVPEVPVSISSNTAALDISDPVENVVLTVDGEDVTLYSGGASDLVIQSGTITVTPEEYWSYNGVVDTSTGDALIPAQTDVSYYFQCPCP